MKKIHSPYLNRESKKQRHMSTMYEKQPLWGRRGHLIITQSAHTLDVTLPTPVLEKIYHSEVRFQISKRRYIVIIE